jgi:hypothetical protein
VLFSIPQQTYRDRMWRATRSLQDKKTTRHANCPGQSREPDGVTERVDRVLTDASKGLKRNSKSKSRSRCPRGLLSAEKTGKGSEEGVETDGQVEGSHDGRMGRGGQVEKDHGLTKFLVAIHLLVSQPQVDSRK